MRVFEWLHLWRGCVLISPSLRRGWGSGARVRAVVVPEFACTSVLCPCVDGGEDVTQALQASPSAGPAERKRRRRGGGGGRARALLCGLCLSPSLRPPRTRRRAAPKSSSEGEGRWVGWLRHTCGHTHTAQRTSRTHRVKIRGRARESERREGGHAGGPRQREDTNTPVRRGGPQKCTRDSTSVFAARDASLGNGLEPP